MEPQDMDKTKIYLNRQNTLIKCSRQLAIWLVLIALVTSPVVAAPLGQDPTPPTDPDTGEEVETFIEFGPPNGDEYLANLGPAPVIVEEKRLEALNATQAFMEVSAANAGDLPSYDSEAVEKFDALNSLEIVRQLSVGIGPRLSGTPQEREAAEYLGSILQSYGFEVTIQTFSQTLTRNVAKVTSPNVELPGGPNWQMSSSTSAKITGDSAPVQAEVVYAGSGQLPEDFPPDTAGKIVMVNYSGSSSIRSAAVVNAVNHGAVAVILVRTESNSAPPNPFSLSTPQPDVPVIGGGSAHRVWLSNLLAAGPLTLTIATNRYVGLEGVNVIGVRHAVDDPEGTTAPIVMIGAHIDSVLGGPGAHDNATGPAASLEIARVLSQYVLDKEIRFGGYGNEEGGLRGSRAYVANLSDEERARFVGEWDLDMMGTPYEPAGFWALTPDGRSNGVVQSAYDAAARAGFADLQNCKLGQSDHQSFFDVGIPSSLFIWLDYRPPADCITGRGSYVTEPQYHRPNDTMDNVSPERLQITLDVVGGAVFHNALNAVTLSATDYRGAPITGATVRADCGEGWRNLGSTDSGGSLLAVIPHATCDFTATTLDSLSVTNLKDVEITGDRALAFPPPLVLDPYVDPNPVLLHGSATAYPNVIFSPFDVSQASCDAVDTSSVGAKAVACSASDIEGNTTTAFAAYNVVYDFAGFFDPVDNPPKFNISNSGQAIPLKWRITDANGIPVTDLASVAVTTVNLACSLKKSSDPVEEYATGASGLQNLGDGYYQFNWATPKNYANSCKTMKLDLGEGPGMERTALFQFRR